MTDLRPGRFSSARTEDRLHIIFEEAMTHTAYHDPSLQDYPSDDWSPEEKQRFWSAYLDLRTGTYEYRCRRFDAVIDQLREMGMNPLDTVLDVGAGRMEFTQRLREKGHLGFVIPVDGAIDGTDLNVWLPANKVDWVTAIEVIEHVHDPRRLIGALNAAASKGVVVTTPNPLEVDVMAMDATHLVPVHQSELITWGYKVEPISLFTNKDDTLLGWRDVRRR